MRRCAIGSGAPVAGSVRWEPSILLEAAPSVDSVAKKLGLHKRNCSVLTLLHIQFQAVFREASRFVRVWLGLCFITCDTPSSNGDQRCGPCGGTVVHISSGVSGLVAGAIVGPRRHVEKELGPANAPFVILGGSLLWFGWLGFNGGSALSVSDGVAARAVATTFVAAASSMLSWLMLERLLKGKSSSVGASVGAGRRTCVYHSWSWLRDTRLEYCYWCFGCCLVLRLCGDREQGESGR